jgi:hypothetical protein
MKVACGLVGFNFEKKGLELLVTVYDMVLKKKGETSINDLVDIHIEVDRKYKEKELTNG